MSKKELISNPAVLWRVALQELAIKMGIPHPGVPLPAWHEQWNKIEHRMFSHITRNWRGRPLISQESSSN